jgi:hypothetical protein
MKRWLSGLVEILPMLLKIVSSFLSAVLLSPQEITWGVISTTGTVFHNVETSLSVQPNKRTIASKVNAIL